MRQFSLTSLMKEGLDCFVGTFLEDEACASSQ